VKVIVDFDVCASTGGYASLVPGVFEVSDDGFLYMLQEEPAEELHERVVEAVDLCPTAAITIEN
jgi:ferredoxin